MDPINNLNPALEALRRQLAENIDRLRRSGKLAAGTRAAQAERPGVEGLEAALRRRISALDRASPEGKRRATRIFVEAVLAAEFGEAVLADPGLGEMLGEISASLLADPQLSERLDRLFSEL